MKNPKVLLFLTLLWSWGCSSAEAIRIPQYRIGVRDALSISDMRLCVQAGALAAGWTIEGERGTAVLAGVQTKGAWAKVVIEYRPNAYRILHYKSHPILHHEGDHISWRYNGWVERLDTYLRQSVARAMSEKAAAQAAHSLVSTVSPSNGRPQQMLQASPHVQPSPMPEAGADDGMSDAQPETEDVAQEFDTAEPEPTATTD